MNQPRFNRQDVYDAAALIACGAVFYAALLVSASHFGWSL